MDKLQISTAQFENKSGDNSYNLSVIERLANKASQEGSNVIAFHECSITGYTFARNLSKEQMLDLAELKHKNFCQSDLLRILAFSHSLICNIKTN